MEFNIDIDVEGTLCWRRVPKVNSRPHSHFGEEFLDVCARADLLGECVEDVEGEHIRLDLVILQRKASHTAV